MADITCLGLVTGKELNAPTGICPDGESVEFKARGVLELSLDNVGEVIEGAEVTEIVVG